MTIKAYRQFLRDLPAQEGAPWDGGGELTPWPELPEV
ncbi:MAG: phage tail assembly chaperone [Desulfovibrio desulfuricans]|nr:phage tail assembly chaperone [Desulfovibrio desulfuricans]